LKVELGRGGSEENNIYDLGGSTLKGQQKCAVRDGCYQRPGGNKSDKKTIPRNGIEGGISIKEEIGNGGERRKKPPIAFRAGVKKTLIGRGSERISILRKTVRKKAASVALTKTER